MPDTLPASPLGHAQTAQIVTDGFCWDGCPVANYGSIFYLRPKGNTSWLNGVFLEEVGLIHFEVDGAAVDTLKDDTHKGCFHHEPGRTWVHFDNFVRPFISLDEEIIATGGHSLALRYTFHNIAPENKEVTAFFRLTSDRAACRTSLADGRVELEFPVREKGGKGLGVTDFSNLRLWFIEAETQQLHVQFPAGIIEPFELTRRTTHGEIAVKHGAEARCPCLVPANGSASLTILLNYGSAQDLPREIANHAAVAWDKFTRDIERPAFRNEEEKRIFFSCWEVLFGNEVTMRNVHWLFASFIHPTVFVWDTSPFSVNAYLHKSPALAQVFTVAQLESIKTSGMMPLHNIEGLTRREEQPDEITQIPLVADSIWKIFQVTRDLDYARLAYTKMKPNYDWFERKRKPVADVPLWGIDDRRAPYFYGPESGMDNVAVFDDGPKYSVGINGAKFSFERAMEGLANALEMPEESAEWGRRKAATRQYMIDHMWDAETGYAYALYYDLSKKMMKTCDLFAGLYVDVFPREIVRQLMATLEREFMTEYGLTSASRLEPTFDPDNMARGPVWIFMNYCVYHAARLHDQHALADRILAGTLRLMKEFPGVYESINPTTRALARTKVGPICYPRMSFCAAGVVNMLYER
jgi:hypothetical protein